MVESIEGIGGLHWSFGRDEAGMVQLMQGKTALATLSAVGEQHKLLLVTVPQVWEAADDLLTLIASGQEAMGSPLAVRLGNALAKAVGEEAWRRGLGKG